jgi:peptide chain release factor 1
VLDPEGEDRFQLNESEVSIVAARGSGPGGQHRNKTESCIVATHKPTGLIVKIDMRSQHQSKMMALQILSARLAQQQREAFTNARAAKRKSQLGAGQRGDKRRTYRFQDDRVTDHVTGKTWKLSKWLRGDW